jgi:hypothetical protein
MKKSLLSFLLTAICLSISSAVFPATVNVSIKDLAFKPPTVAINAGDTQGCSLLISIVSSMSY